MGFLDSITRGKIHGPRKILLYGTRGIGKTTFGNNAPRPVIIPTEDRQNHIDAYGRGPLVKSFSEYLAALDELRYGEHDYKTAVTDSADWLDHFINSDAARFRNVQTLEEIPYKDGYEFAVPLWMEALEKLTALRNEREMNIILLAHYKVEKFKPPETESYNRYAPKLSKPASDKLQEWCDEVLFVRYKTITTKVSEGFGTSRTIAVGGDEREIMTTERPSHMAKNSHNLPDSIPFPQDRFPPELAIVT